MFTQHKNRKKILLVSSLVLASVAVLGGSLYVLRNKKSNNTTVAGVEVKPASEEEKQDAENNKDRISAQIDKQKTEQGQSSTPTNSSATVTITYASQSGDQIEVSSYVSGVFEDGGTCKLTMSKGSKTVTKQTTGERDATTTMCPSFSIAKAELGESGTWSAQVGYSSAKISDAKSSPKEIEVKL